jgi:acid phosphatase family membrane protein YuiD
MSLAEFFGNHILQAALFSYLIGGILKVLFYYLGRGKIELKMLFRTGGMPSTHTATVTAMTSTIYMLEGVSNLFIVCFIVSLVIISDALGVRRAAGKQAQLLNDIVGEFQYTGKFKTKKLYELLGHTPQQVLGGLILGILVAFGVSRF